MKNTDQDTNKATRKGKKTIGMGRPKAKHPALQAEAKERMKAWQTIQEIPDEVERAIARRVFERHYVNPELRAKEPMLQRRAWVAYGYMDSIERTALFTQEYIAAYRRACALMDPVSAKRKRPIKTALFENCRDVITSLYKARQAADERGMPYDLFLDIILQGRVKKDRCPRPPLPNQILSRKHSMARLRGHPTRAEIGARLFHRQWDRRFFAGDAAEDPVRAAALTLMHADVLQAPKPHGRLARYLAIRGAVSPVRASAMFGNELTDAALCLIDVQRPTLPTPTPSYIPPCRGHRVVARDSPCGSCAYTKQCKGETARVTGRLIAAVGSGNPIIERRREQDRVRQDRCRAKKKSGS